MTIGIIGSGNVGGTLGTRWAQNGHTVLFGTRSPDSGEIKALLSRAGSRARAVPPREAAKAEVLVLATPWSVNQEVLKSLGDLSGKILVDVTNPLTPDFSGLALGTTTSGAEQVAQWAKGAKVVKALNAVGFNIMANPRFGPDSAVMFFCGDDASAKHVVKGLAEELGFEARDAGPLTQARLLEPFAMLWISLALAQGYGREFAFKLLRRE